MSKFAVYLDSLIKQRGESISQIAKGAAVERTSIHKALKDERVLPYNALEQLTQYLQLTLSESRELHQYYDIILHGEEFFQAQSLILEILSELSQLSFITYKNMSFPSISFESNEMPELVYGKPQIEAAVQTIFQHEAQLKGAEIKLYLPPKSDLSDSLLQLWKSGYDFKATQILPFLPNHHDSGTNLDNLRTLKKILPLSILSRSNYTAYYYFEENSNNVDINPLSYFIITPNHLLTFDEKLTVMQIQSSSELLSLYIKRFSSITKECTKLNSYSVELPDVIKSYMESCDPDKFYTLMSQPCFGHYYTTERIERQFIKNVPHREQLVELADRHFSDLCSAKEFYTVYTEKGLRNFTDTGIIVDLPPEYILPFDVSIRLDMLKEMKSDIENKKIHSLIVDSEEVVLPDYLTFICDEQHGLHIYAVQGYIGGTYDCNIHIRDASIGKSFCDFIKALPSGRLVYSEEKTLSTFDELIENLEKEKAEKRDNR